MLPRLSPPPEDIVATTNERTNPLQETHFFISLTHSLTLREKWPGIRCLVQVELDQSHFSSFSCIGDIFFSHSLSHFMRHQNMLYLFFISPKSFSLSPSRGTFFLSSPTFLSIFILFL
ncbi:hypothetical protein MVEG_07717 [Podila verticillata NRRL 6337]|nr:hypothetical protein MVEG_07717 [Podila verticillata NRRL 6337]